MVMRMQPKMCGTVDFDVSCANRSGQKAACLRSSGLATLTKLLLAPGSGTLFANVSRR